MIEFSNMAEFDPSRSFNLVMNQRRGYLPHSHVSETHSMKRVLFYYTSKGGRAKLTTAFTGGKAEPEC